MGVKVDGVQARLPLRKQFYAGRDLVILLQTNENTVTVRSGDWSQVSRYQTIQNAYKAIVNCDTLDEVKKKV